MLPSGVDWAGVSIRCCHEGVLRTSDGGCWEQWTSGLQIKVQTLCLLQFCSGDLAEYLAEGGLLGVDSDDLTSVSQVINLVTQLRLLKG